MSDLLLGVDLGTSGVKVGLFDRVGHRLTLTRRAYPLHAPHSGWAEQEPGDWWAATCSACREALDGADPSQVVAMGLTGQTPGHVMVTAKGEPLGRALIWQDRRARSEATWISGEFQVNEMVHFTGLPLTSDSALPAARLLWLRDHRPDEWSICRWILQPQDFLALRFTSQVATDVISAYGLAHIQDGHYSEEYFHRLAIPVEKMPPAYVPEHIVGHLTSLAADATGLVVNTPVVVGTIDAWCNVLGAGGVVEGRAVDVAGTSEIVALVARASPAAPGIMSMPLFDDLAFFGGPTQVGANAIEWLSGILGLDHVDNPRSILEQAAHESGAGAGGVLFLPYLSGERAPVWDDRACGAFVGFRKWHSLNHMARAVYEGVAFAVRHILTLAESSTELTATDLRVCGGGSRSQFWNQLKADVTGKRVLELQVAETAALGAAMWAAVAIGLHSDMRTAADAMVKLRTEWVPNASLSACYAELADIYMGLYERLRDTFAGLDDWRRQYWAPNPNAATRVD